MIERDYWFMGSGAVLALALRNLVEGGILFAAVGLLSATLLLIYARDNGSRRDGEDAERG